MNRQYKQHARDCFWGNTECGDYIDRAEIHMQRVLLVFIGICGVLLLAHNCPLALIAIMGVVIGLGVAVAD